MGIRCIIFDLDGVLIDSWRLMDKAFCTAYAACGFTSIPPIQEFRRQIGRPLPQITKELGLPAKFVSVYENTSRSHIDLVVPFAGVTEVLERLRALGFSIALNTSKSRLRTEEILFRFSLMRYFDAIVTGSDVDNGKPHPESIHRILNVIGLKPTETAFVGDMPVDMHCARAANVMGIAALWGIGKLEELRVAGSISELSKINDLPDFLVNLSSGVVGL